MPKSIPDSYFDREPESIQKCRYLNQSILAALGGKLFGSYFAINSQSTITNWIHRGTGPLMWIRNLLIGIEKEGHSIALVKNVLDFLANPFELSLITRPKKSISYVSLVKEITGTTRECALVQSVFAEISEDGMLTLDELIRLRESIRQDVDCVMRLESQCNVLIEQAKNNGGSVQIESTFKSQENQ